MGFFTAAQVAYFSASQLQLLSSAQVQALSPGQLSALSAAQVAALVGSMTAAQAQALTQAQLSGLNSAQLAAVQALLGSNQGSSSANQNPSGRDAQAAINAANLVQRAAQPTAQLPKVSSEVSGLVGADSIAAGGSPVRPVLGTAGSGASAGATPAGPSPSAAAGTRSDIEVQVVERPSRVQTGLISVKLPVEVVAARAGFVFALPSDVVAQMRSNIKVTLADGSPLPSWLKFNAVTREFTASAVPSQALPIRVRLASAGQQLIVSIEER
jgi:hypothetical protein